MLVLEDVVLRYGPLEVVHGVSLEVNAGEAVALVGPNGAGKSTIALACGGLMAPASGSIRWEGKDLRGVPAHRYRDLGIALALEGRRLFRSQTVRENLHLGAYRRLRKRESVADQLALVLELFPVLARKQSHLADSLSGGEQQMLVIGQALMARPHLLVLEEPSAGLAPLLVEQVYESLGVLRGSGLSVLVMEQSFTAALSFCERGYVLDTGTVTHAGTAAELLTDPSIQAAYLGVFQ